MKTMESNSIFETAAQFVNNTSRSIFLTGRAGTGKTTFLKYITENTPKRTIVVAPTGVAAINAAGVTLHSMFQVPLGPFVPVSSRGSEGVTDKFTLFKNIRVSDEKRQLFRDLELLIIDEISMVRSDTLDAIDAILRYFRKRQHLPFGGVQVLYIGDLFQLPPVMPDNEWAILKEYYKSEFFFHSRVVEQFPPIYVELKKIYRQNEQTFIEILNRVRNSKVTSIDLEILNARYNVIKHPDKSYITLTSHNYKADKINQEELRKLPGKVFEFKGVIEGEFQEKALPTDVTLQLKVGAQVMFIRNDKSDDRRYFNGKIAKVKSIPDPSNIIVELNEDGEELLLEKETWNNIKYTYNAVDEKIDEEKLGSFSQFPVRLAWAITIHKSQGLTFEHAIIDAGESFAPGQVYVALSRCVSIDGMILHSKIDQRSISTHQQVLEFSSKAMEEETLSRILDEERQIHLNSQLLETFDLQRMIDVLESFHQYCGGKKIPNPEEIQRKSFGFVKIAREQQQVALKFKAQLESLLREGDADKIKNRVVAAIDYFRNALKEKLLQEIEIQIEQIQNIKKVKKFLKRFVDVRLEVVKKINGLQTVSYRGESLYDSQMLEPLEKAETKAALKKNAKVEKGASLEETLTLLKKNLSLDLVAEARGLAISTIEGHVAQLVRNGEIDINIVIPKTKLDHLVKVISESGSSSLVVIKHKAGDEFSFGDIRIVLNYLNLLQSRK
jgi:hypothetical protein